MQQVTPDEAKEQLAELIAAALRGETVVIGTPGEQAVQLVPSSQMRQQRKVGSARGLIHMSVDFDAPLSDFEDYAR